MLLAALAILWVALEIGRRAMLLSGRDAALCSGVCGQLVDAGEERQQRYIAKCYAVASLGEGFEGDAVYV